MDFLIDFLHQKSPKSGTEMPVYYRKALITGEALLAVYLSLCYVVLGLTTREWQSFPLLLFAGVIASILNMRRLKLQVNLAVFAAAICIWSGWFVYRHGWNCGAQHFLVPLLVLNFFNIFEPPWFKVLCFFAIIGYRMALFAYSLNHAPVVALGQGASVALQLINSTMTLLILACDCILFSTNLQATERQLRIDNQQLHKQAGTDPLTQLPNRRAMLDEIGLFLKHSPNDHFSVAIADIDHFKNVNDTYGHNCGDYTLRMLADLFRAKAGEEYRVCRWGGEEFCFFLPGKNIDEAGLAMLELSEAVRNMPLSFEGSDYSITITIGVEECDFTSDIDVILESADHKLYMGKNSGRNRVVV